MKTWLLAGILLLGATGADSDGDGVADAEDRCPQFADPSQADTNGDGIGDVCQCGDANGDGRVTVSDLVAANQMARGETAASPLCDANGTGPDDKLRCESTDLGAINGAIHGNCFPVCARYAKPPQGKSACTGATP
jgi:hypothetical protein